MLKTVGLRKSLLGRPNTPNEVLRAFQTPQNSVNIITTADLVGDFSIVYWFKTSNNFIGYLLTLGSDIPTVGLSFILESSRYLVTDSGETQDSYTITAPPDPWNYFNGWWCLNWRRESGLMTVILRRAQSTPFPLLSFSNSDTIPGIIRINGLNLVLSYSLSYSHLQYIRGSAPSVDTSKVFSTPYYIL